MSASIWDQKTLRALSGLVGALLVPVLWSWMIPPDAPTAVASRAAVGPDRQVASVSSTAPPAPGAGKLSRPVTVDWNLASKEWTREIDGTHLRIKGEQRGWKAERIVNGSNGFTASVFTTPDGYTTDYIELKEGENQIRLDLTDASGRHSQKTLTVTRQPASLESEK